jgi:GMP synthase (glutamine-hydrolysing)
VVKQALVIRHAPYERLAGFRLPIEQAGYAVAHVDVAEPGFATHDLEAPDLLVVLGGPMAVYEHAAHPWIEGEIARLARRLAAEKPTLGVCLGAQMIAAALGGAVRAGPTLEGGFAPLTLTEAGAASPLRHLAGVPVLHWHGDTFDLPPDVALLASTALYPNQAFMRDGHLLALQCHPEMGEDASFERWLAHGGAWLRRAGTTADALRAEYARHGPRAVAAGRTLLGEWLAGLVR